MKRTLIVITAGITLAIYIRYANINYRQRQQELDNLRQDIRVLENRLTKKDELIKDLKTKQERNKVEVTRSAPVKGKLLGIFEATAYTDNITSQGKWVGQTASGLKPQVGVIAVDPKVIPLGTKLYVEGYGDCIAGDTGGAIKGYRIDLFKNTSQECREWRRRKVKVFKRD